jgi:hypothetical protein
MSSRQQRLPAINDTAHLYAQLSELNRLREEVRKAQRSARTRRRKSRRNERTLDARRPAN